MPEEVRTGERVGSPGAEVNYSLKPPDMGALYKQCTSLISELLNLPGRIFGFLLGFGFIKRRTNVAQARLGFSASLP